MALREMPFIELSDILAGGVPSIAQLIHGGEPRLGAGGCRWVPRLLAEHLAHQIARALAILEQTKEFRVARAPSVDEFGEGLLLESLNPGGSGGEIAAPSG